MNMSEACMTALDRWKELAEVENRRARDTWGSLGGWYQRPEHFEDPEITDARQRRDTQIVAWHADGLSTREISRRTGLVGTTITRILRLHRLAAGEAVRGRT